MKQWPGSFRKLKSTVQMKGSFPTRACKKHGVSTALARVTMSLTLCTCRLSIITTALLLYSQKCPDLGDKSDGPPVVLVLEEEVAPKERMTEASERLPVGWGCMWAGRAARALEGFDKEAFCQWLRRGNNIYEEADPIWGGHTGKKRCTVVILRECAYRPCFSRGQVWR